MALKSYSYYEGLLSDPRVQAALNTVSWSDGLMDHPLAGDDVYSTTYGYDKFDNSGWHPGNQGRVSSAVGKYQAMAYSFPDIATQIGIPNIGPVNQDVFAVALMDRAGALPDVLSGNVSGMIDKLNGVWTSLPGHPTQAIRTKEQVESAYKDYYSAAKNNPSTLGYTNPQQAAKTKDSPVLAAQRALAGMGYIPNDDINGRYGKVGSKGRYTYDKSLVEGIKEFQAAHGLPETGELNDATLATIEQQSTAQNARDARLSMVGGLPAAPPAALSAPALEAAYKDFQQSPNGPIIDAVRSLGEATRNSRNYAGMETARGKQFSAMPPASNPYADFEQARAANFSMMPPETTNAAINNRIDQAFAPANLARIDQASYQPTVAGRPEYPGSLPMSVNERFASFEKPAQNSPEKAIENAVRNAVHDRLASGIPETPRQTNMGISAAIGGAGRPAAPSVGSMPGTTPAGLGGLNYSVAPASRPAAPPVSAGMARTPAQLGGLNYSVPPATQPSLADQYASYGAGKATTNRAPNDTRASAYRSMPPAPVMAAAIDRIDIPGSAKPAAPAISPATLAAQYASYGAGKIAPTQTAASATQSAPKPSQAIAQKATPPAMSAAPRTVAPRQVTPYAPPAAPAMTPERAKALGMVPTPGVPGAYMPNVPGNQAQVMADQAKLIAANPIASIGKMLAGTMLGGVFHAGGGLRSAAQNVAQAVGGNRQQSERDRLANALASVAMGGVGGSYNGPGGVGGYSGGGFQASPSGFGNYGSAGFNSGMQSSSGFTYDR